MIFKSKRCPRCGFKVDKEINVCPSCGLNYVKFNTATNKEAKNALHSGQNDKVLKRTGCPSDIKRWKLLLITIFLGFTGAHQFYVGKVKTGAFYCFFFIVGVVNAIVKLVAPNLPHNDFLEVFNFMVLVWGVVICLWLIDIFKVSINRFKIPVSLP